MKIKMPQSYKLGWLFLVLMCVYFSWLETRPTSTRQATFDADTLFMRVVKVATDHRIVTDKDGKILYAAESAAIIFDYTPVELVGTNIEKLIPQRYLEKHRAAKNRALKQHTGQISPPVICYGLKKDGTERKVELRAKVDWEPGLGETVMVTVFPAEMVKEL